MHTTIKFKGDRRYLHGTDLLPYALAAVQEEEGTQARLHSMEFKGFVDHQVACVRNPSPRELESAKIVGTSRPAIEGAIETFVLVETDEPVQGAGPYNERDVLDQVAAGDQAGMVRVDQGRYSSIEKAVAYIKDFCNKNYPLDEFRWVFTGFQSETGISNLEEISGIKFKACLAHRFVRFEVFSPDRSLAGRIDFARVKK